LRVEFVEGVFAEVTLPRTRKLQNRMTVRDKATPSVEPNGGAFGDEYSKGTRMITA
jgi:hypothetical protein